MKPIVVIAAALALGAAAPAFSQSKDKEAARAKDAQPKSQLSKQDRQYLSDMALADMAEVEAGKLAARKAQSAEVKKYAEHMQQDHAKSLEEGKQIAQSKGVTPPAAPAKKHQDALNKLAAAPDTAFDKAYMQQMVKDHEETLKKLQKAAKDAKDPEIKAKAEKAAPDVQKHLEMAKQIVAGLDDKGSASRGQSAKK